MNKLLEIDKEAGTEYAMKMQSSPLGDFIDYIEFQARQEMEAYPIVQEQWAQFKAGSSIDDFDEGAFRRFLDIEAAGRISEVMEYTVGFLTASYKKSDINVVKNKLLMLALKLQTSANFRKDHFSELKALLSLIEAKSKLNQPL